jgi:hypothetical protein
MKQFIFTNLPVEIKMIIFNYCDPKVKCYVCTPKNGKKVVKITKKFKENETNEIIIEKDLIDYYCPERNQVVFFNCDEYQLQFYSENLKIEVLKSTIVKVIYMRESKINLFFLKLLTMKKKYINRSWGSKIVTSHDSLTFFLEDEKIQVSNFFSLF